MTHSNEQLPALDPRDHEYVAQVTDPQLQARMIRDLSRYRRRPSLQEGDKVPSLIVTRLADSHPMSLEALGDKQPVMLIFGSYT